ncbi:signal peptidase I [Kineococcus sp. SYSU DK003]|uniref:signal peptidase I n=1 Tax=Kineococcus sp. SYSU DK003 TaxID=3383124 RepID=UPI003D7C7FF6
MSLHDEHAMTTHHTGHVEQVDQLSHDTQVPDTAAQNASGRFGLRHWAREAVLTVAALGGLICLLAIGAAVFCDITLVMFRTGSMSPAIPAGAVAVVRAVPATQVQVGDVVTVARPDALPVTHRVVSIAPNPQGTVSSRLLTLKGDANASADPTPYPVTEVRRVVISEARLGNWINQARSPLALGATTLFVGALVTWTFWPAATSPSRIRAHH